MHDNTFLQLACELAKKSANSKQEDNKKQKI
jgi:hypothetical protein